MDDKYKNTPAGKWVEDEVSVPRQLKQPRFRHRNLRARVESGKYYDGIPACVMSMIHLDDKELRIPFPEFHALCKWGMETFEEERLPGIGDSDFVSYCFYISAINEKDSRIKELEIARHRWGQSQATTIRHLEKENETLAQTVRDQEKMIKDHGTWWSNKVTDLADDVLKAEKILKAARMEI